MASIPYNPRAQRSTGANGGYGAPAITSSPYQAKSGEPAQPSGGFQRGSLYRSPYQNAGGAFPNYPRFEEAARSGGRAMPTSSNPQFAHPMSDAEDPNRLKKIGFRERTSMNVGEEHDLPAEAAANEDTKNKNAQKEAEAVGGTSEQNADTRWDMSKTPEQRANDIAASTQSGVVGAQVTRGGNLQNTRAVAASPFLTPNTGASPMTPSSSGAPTQTPVNVPNTTPAPGGGVQQASGAPTMDSTGQTVKANLAEAAGIKTGTPTPSPVASTPPPMNQPITPGRLPVPGAAPIPNNPFASTPYQTKPKRKDQGDWDPFGRNTRTSGTALA